MKSYVYQIDSLNQLNTQLLTENQTVREHNQRLQYEVDEVIEKNDELELEVKKAAVIKAININPVCYKRRNRDTDKARKAETIKVHFRLMENTVAEPGPRNIFLRIIRPDSYVLVNNAQNLMEFEGKHLAYSASREVQYEGSFLDVSIYYHVQQELLAGKYQVLLYMDQEIIGESEFILK